MVDGLVLLNFEGECNVKIELPREGIGLGVFVLIEP